MRAVLSLLIFFTAGFIAHAQQKTNYEIFTVAFYNVENLFDTVDDPLTFDNDRTPLGKDRWTQEIYDKKMNNMAYAISRIGKEKTGSSPVLIGLCEVENREVLEDLISRSPLKEEDYGIIHYDAPDQRGIDVALLYKKNLFTPQNSQPRELYIFDKANAEKRVYTRDQLVVTGFLNSEKIHLLVNHWPSRSGGAKRSNYRREAAARLSRRITDSLLLENPYAKILNMGDFNDDPKDKSLSLVLGTFEKKEDVTMKTYYNPMASLHRKGLGTSAYRDGWNLFDQILISKALLTDDKGLRFYQAGIFNEKFLITSSGQYRGYPFRSMGQTGFTDGYSDHFPVYVYLIQPLN